MSEYEVSIIVPTHNLENDIEKTFNSIKSQTLGFDKIELIFVDDSSTDNTLNILNDYAKDYENVKVFSTDENSGYAGKPRNIGISNSTSDYLLFLDGDDQLLVDACKFLVNRIKSSDVDMVVGGQINVFKNGVLQHNPPLYNGKNQYFNNTVNQSLLTIRPAISAKLFKKELIEKNNIRFPEGIPGQDLVFLQEAIIASDEIVTVNDFYVYYRNLTDNSVTFNLNEQYFTGLINAYILVCNIFEKYAVDVKIQESVMHNHLSFFTTQVIKASSVKEMDMKLKEILNSQSFNELSNNKVFTNNQNFQKYFEDMKLGNYNTKSLDEIFKQINHEFKNVVNMKLLIEELQNIKLQQSRILDENKSLKETSLKIFNEYEIVNNELKEIKSSKLWKLKSKFNLR